MFGGVSSFLLKYAYLRKKSHNRKALKHFSIWKADIHIITYLKPLNGFSESYKKRLKIMIGMLFISAKGFSFIEGGHKEGGF